MVGRAQLDLLQLRKQALILESSLNRRVLQAEVQSLRWTATRIRDTSRTCRTLAPWLVFLASVMGVLAIRSSRRPQSVIGRLASVAKWVQPLYSLWRGFTVGRR